MLTVKYESCQSVCLQNMLRLGRPRANNACNKHNCSLTESHQYVHCVAGIYDDHKAAGSEMKKGEKVHALLKIRLGILDQDQKDRKCICKSKTKFIRDLTRDLSYSNLVFFLFAKHHYISRSRVPILIIFLMAYMGIRFI